MQGNRISMDRHHDLLGHFCTVQFYYSLYFLRNNRSLTNCNDMQFDLQFITPFHVGNKSLRNSLFYCLSEDF